MVTTLVAFTPVFTCCNFQKPRIISPQPISNTRAIASSPATKTRRKLCAPELEVVEPEVSFNESCKFFTTTENIGARPKSTPVKTVANTVNSKTRKSMPISPARIVCGNWT